MVPERLAWAGAVIMACVGIYLSYVPLANSLGKVVITILGGLVLLAAVLMFPWRRRADGSPTRLISPKVSGSNNRTQSAGDNSSQYMAGRDAKVDNSVRRDSKG